MEPKKISFGFSKISKKPELIPRASRKDNGVQLIDCLEGQFIKIKDAVEVKDELLVIPVQGSSNKLIDEIKKAREKRMKNEIKEEDDEKPDEELTLDELAARELIREAKNQDSVKSKSKVHSLPLEDKFVAEGAAEPSLEDYDNVPISDYGMAMLRGMNWKEGMPIGKRPQKVSLPTLPELRPKGLGLGANKMVASNTQLTDSSGKVLQLVKGAYCKIIAGIHRGHYCEVQGLDDENCRVIVKTAQTNEVLSLNEFLVCPVSREEFEKGSRVINNAKHDEYRERERSSAGDKDSSPSRDKHSSPSRDKHKSRTKDKKKKSDSEDERRRRKHKKKKSRRRDSDSDSDRGRRHSRHLNK